MPLFYKAAIPAIFCKVLPGWSSPRYDCPVILLPRIISLFLKLGATGFGGPAALVSLMEKECSQRLKWISASQFNEAYVLCKLLPGPVAFQMALWMGHHVRGRLGGLVAGLSLLIPGFFMVLSLSFFYHSVSRVPQFAPALEGMRVGALVVILDSVVRMFKPYRGDAEALILLFVAIVLMVCFPRFEPLIILSGGLSMIFIRTRFSLHGFSPVLLQLFWVHFKAGAFVFGTGLAILPVLEHDAVHLYHWLSPGEFLDGIAFGQITPGPVTITSVFIGHQAAGVLGAIAAALGMYLPGVILILGFMPSFKKKFGEKIWLHQFQRGAIPMVIGCVVGAALELCRMNLTHFRSVSLFVVLALIAATGKFPSWLLIPLGSALGTALFIATH